jgi:microcystin-dependent protein
MIRTRTVGTITLTEALAVGACTSYSRKALAHVGEIITMAYDRGVPEGYLECNGAEVSRSVYANLYAFLGDAYGPGDGETTFNLPDFRGAFLRGRDDGTLTAEVGVKQLDAAPNITGTIHCRSLSTSIGWLGAVYHYRDAPASAASGSYSTADSFNASYSHSSYGRDSTTEIRPANYSVYYYIKY